MPVDSLETTPETDDAPTIRLAASDPAETQSAPAIIGGPADSGAAVTCPVCGLVNQPGTTICSRCLTNWATTEITAQLDIKLALSQVARNTADPAVSSQSPELILEIGNVRVPVNIDGVVIVGRNQQVSDGQPRSDVDLTPFGAALKGVSRKHAKLTRDHVLVHVTDLGSTNGTLVNGQPILPYARRTLRNGDELQLGQLKMKVILAGNS